MICKLRFFSLATISALLLTTAALPAQNGQAADSLAVHPARKVMPRPTSVPRARLSQDNHAAVSRPVSQTPEPVTQAPRSTSHPLFGGTWQVGTNAGPDGAANPLLLTDGTVMVASGNSPYWYRLTPDNTGSYVNGTWTQLASLPVIGGTQYAPLYHSSVVLPDGRVVIMGGEYNGSNTEVWTNLGAIYDPVANAWTAVTAPAGSSWTSIGDSESTILADGTFMQASCCAYPDANALFDPTTLGWTTTGAPNAGDSYQDEQGYELLPNGNVLTIDIWTNYSSGDNGGNATNAEQYDPATGLWISAGNTPVSLPDPSACGTYEIGPAVLRADGTVVAFGGNTGCVTGKTDDPTAIYDSTSGTWSAGPNVLAVCGTAGKTSCTLADAPAALLPNGNVLFAASSGYGQSPTHFFEFTTANKIKQVADTVDNSAASGSYYYNFLVLPNGQILSTDFSSEVEFYTPVASTTTGWAPVISTFPSAVTAGTTYSISGTQFNGLSQGAYYGDDVQGSTNYPIVQITNTDSGDVYYARTTNPNNSSIAPGNSVTASFTMPATAEVGASTLVVIANGIASKPVSITVSAPSTTVTLTPTSLKFGNVVINTTSAAKSVTLDNTGSVTLNLSSVVATGDFAISANTCGTTLAAGKKCKVSVTFTPTTVGALTGALTFTDNAAGSPQTVALSGTGEEPAVLTPATYTFPKQTVGTTSNPKVFTLTNNQATTLSKIKISITGNFAVSSTTCTTTLGSKDKCTIDVTFTPTTTGTQTGTLTVKDSASNTPQTAALTGTGK